MTPWTAAHQAPLSVGFPRQEYWSGLPVPSPENLPDPGIKPGSPVLQADSLPSELPGKPTKEATKSNLRHLDLTIVDPGVNCSFHFQLNASGLPPSLSLTPDKQGSRV